MATLAAPLAPARPQARPLVISRWLFLVAGLVLVMVAVGGITRLTESGLSITRWDLVTGTLPPLGAADWQAEFDRYRQTTQYRELNRGMSLAEFQHIYFWEWFHRLLGRLIGLAFALPLAVYWLRGWIPGRFKPRLLVLLALGGLQGAIGWWMVMSGLADRVDVAPERLAVHLSMALVLLAALMWTALSVRGAAPAAKDRPRAWVWPLVLLLGAQVVLGALVAGMEAGYAFNSWPLMGDEVMPAAAWSQSPWWTNLTANPVGAQFAHRTLAWAVAAAALWAAWRTARAGAGWRAGLVAFTVLVQFALGVLTLVHGVPIALGVAHQAMAAVLVGAVSVLAHWATRRAGERPEALDLERLSNHKRGFAGAQVR